MIAPILMPKLGASFLDKALALRLESIQAQQLVNALGRAERLGYDVRDVVAPGAAGRAGQEKVIPTANPIPAPMRNPSTADSVPSEQEIMRLGIAFCERCNRPCAGLKALLSVCDNSFMIFYLLLRKVQHQRSGLCGSKPAPFEKLGREYCLFCGQGFLGSGNGIRYHTTNSVCGSYTDDHSKALRSLFKDAEEVWKRKQAAQQSPRVPLTPSQPPSASAQSPGSGDPYSVLTPERRVAFEAKMAALESRYSTQLLQAQNLPPDEQKAEFARIKNTYNTRQSVTRKKFGIRLRERRSRMEIEEERNRLMGSRQHTPASTGPRSVSDASGTPAPAGRYGSHSGQATPQPMLPEMRNDAGPSGTAEHAESRPTAAAYPTPTARPTPTTAAHSNSTAATSPASLTERNTASNSPTAPAAPGAAGATARPMPMSIAGSYTAPIRMPDTVMHIANDGGPIEIDDDDDDDDGDGNGNDDQSGTEMDVDDKEDEDD